MSLPGPKKNARLKRLSAPLEPPGCALSYTPVSVRFDGTLLDHTAQHQLFDLSSSARYVMLSTPGGLRGPRSGVMASSLGARGRG